MWNLKVKGTDVIGYNQQFQELALLCVRMFPEVSEKIERYVGGLPDMIHGSVVASNPKTMQEAIEIATELIDKKICTFAERQTENKESKNDNHNKQQNKSRTRGRPTSSIDLVRRKLTEDLNLCVLNATITMMVHVLLNATSATELAIWPATVKVLDKRDSNVVTSTFLLNNHYASVLFDTGADRSFVSTAFSSQIDITPSTLDHYYDVELVDGRIIGLNAIIRGCTLNFLNHPFNIDLMPVELGSLDIIIGMDWLAKYIAIIVCAEKIILTFLGNETLNCLR
ncbi:reverse transcriptase domain-containing protein [Tanacetum coccineum]